MRPDAVVVDGSPHTWTPVGSDLDAAWLAYASIASGGGTPPDWTMAEDPRTAIPPRDAAGSLWRAGDTTVTPPTIRTAADHLQSVLGLDAEWTVDAVSAYCSSGGRGVFLLCALLGGEQTTHYYVTVWRANEQPRVGASEMNYRMGVDAVIVHDARIHGDDGGAR